MSAILQAGLTGLALLLPVCLSRAQTAAATVPEPEVLTLSVATRDAPVVEPVRHGRLRQNAWIDWVLLAAGPTDGRDAAYLFTTVAREENVQGMTPVFSFVDLSNGALTSLYPDTRIRVREHRAALDLDALMTPRDRGASLELEAAPSAMTTSWVWGKAISGARASSNSLYLATEAEEGKRPMLLRFFPREMLIEELSELPAPAVGLVSAGGTLWGVTRNGRLFSYDEIGGVEESLSLAGRAPVWAGLQADDAGVLYAWSAEPPLAIAALKPAGRNRTLVPLLEDRVVERIRVHEGVPGPWCELAVRAGAEWKTEYARLSGGRVEALAGPPDGQALAARRGYAFAFNVNEEPLALEVRWEKGDWIRYPVVFEKTGRDRLKLLFTGPDDRYLYGAGWPVAWIWRFDPETGRFIIYDRHYVFYEALTWNNAIWVCGYWGIKLLQWKPEEPWTFDYDRHYYRKSFPGNSSPWGDKDVSNPRLIAKFRYLKKLNVRRPGGMALGADNRIYVGGRTPAVEYFNSRYGGALNWYDPATETIGQIRDPFLHHSVRDVCAAGRYVAAAASAYICMYEPLPADFSRGQFVLYDTQARRVVLACSPLDAPLSYAEEGEPGRIVVAGAGAGRYAGEGIRSAFFIFDIAQMRVTHVIRLPIQARWMEYNVLPFKRGPDRKVYFYGADDQGTALFRVDSVTGRVEPVLRAAGITDTAVYNNAGAPFAFFKDRVYFGIHELLSVPLETVTGVK